MIGRDKGSDDSVQYEAGDLARVAALLDQASTESSRYRRFILAKSLFLERGVIDHTAGPVVIDGAEMGDGDLEDDWDNEEDRVTQRLPPLDGAAWAAMRYHVELTVDGKKERARLEPHFIGPDARDPLDTEDQSTYVVAAWVALAGVVESPAARALLSHLAFQSGAPDARGHAQLAAAAYLQVSESDARAVDLVHSARVAVRLARAVGDDELHSAAVHVLEGVAEECLTGERKSVGAAKDALGTLIREQSPRARELIELACATWRADQVGQAFWHLKLQTATDDDDREQIWRDRVAAATATAEASSSNILKASRLRDVLALAEASGVSGLREQAAVLIQGIRNLDLEMMSIRAVSYRFEEQFEEMVASVLSDPDAGDFLVDWKPDPEPCDAEEAAGPPTPTWYLRLRAFAQHGPPTGNPDENRKQIENQYRLAPLQHLFPTQLQTPEGLPLYAPETEDDRFDLDMVTWETQLLEQWTHIYAEALHRIADPEVPPFDALVRVLSEGDDPSNIGHQLAESFFRYWAGDGQAALHTAVPMIEALVRHAVLRAERGIYRLQKKQTPGQYVGLGALLDLFYDIYTVDERDQRFFNAVLRHPGGWNLRNLISHGYLPGINGGVAALALYAALRILALAGKPAPTDDVKDASD